MDFMEKIIETISTFFSKYGGKILISAAILIVGLILVKFAVKLLKEVLKKSRLDPICHKFVVSLSKIVLQILVLIITLSQLGADMSSVVAMLSVAGLAVSLAVKDSLSNLAGGFILLFSKPFSVGDFVEISGVSGTVKHINILQTKLVTPDNKSIHIPNGEVSEAKIINFSSEENRRLEMIFSIGYTSDVDAAKAIIAEVIAKNPLALAEPTPFVRLGELGASSVKILARVWVKNEDYWDLNYDLLEEIKAEFDRNGIIMPFDQLEITMKK